MSSEDLRPMLGSESFERTAYLNPVKHYVRKYGWLPSAQRRLQNLRSNPRRAGDFARYFSLCGPHAIDVILLANNRIIQRSLRGYPGTVVCESKLEVFRDISPRLGQCAGAFHGTFEDVVQKPSFERVCPFDIINLDFTSTLFPNWDRPSSNTVKAIQRIMEIQEKYQRGFDLYLTFRARRQESNPSAVEELSRMMEDNLQDDQDAKSLFTQHCGPSVRGLLEKDFCDFIARTIPKLLIEFGAQHHFIGEHVATYSYMRQKRGGDGRSRIVYYIVKFILAFEFEGGKLSSTHKAISNVRKQVRRTLTTKIVDVRRELQEKPSLWGALRNEVSYLVRAGDPFRP